MVSQVLPARTQNITPRINQHENLLYRKNPNKAMEVCALFFQNPVVDHIVPLTRKGESGNLPPSLHLSYWPKKTIILQSMPCRKSGCYPTLPIFATRPLIQQARKETAIAATLKDGSLGGIKATEQVSPKETTWPGDHTHQAPARFMPPPIKLPSIYGAKTRRDSVPRKDITLNLAS